MATKTKKKKKSETIKDFDCVEFVRKERTRMAKELEGKSVEEVLKYFKSRRLKNAG